MTQYMMSIDQGTTSTRAMLCIVLAQPLSKIVQGANLKITISQSIITQGIPHLQVIAEALI
jgi:glycerol kinase